MLISLVIDSTKSMNFEHCLLNFMVIISNSKYRRTVFSWILLIANLDILKQVNTACKGAQESNFSESAAYEARLVAVRKWVLSSMELPRGSQHIPSHWARKKASRRVQMPEQGLNSSPFRLVNAYSYIPFDLGP